MNSNSSTLPTLISCSSEASLQIYQRLQPTIESLRQHLVDIAEKLVKIFARDPRSAFTYEGKHDDVEVISATVGLDDVMLSMLACVEECGRESGRRYVASAIIACSKEEVFFGVFQALGTTWLTHFLFLFKAGRGMEDDALRSRVFARDGYTCVLTQFPDRSHPNTTSKTRLHLQPARLLSRTIGQFGSKHNAQSHQSALASFDILAKFTGIPIEELRGCLDDPSNGITLEMNAQVALYDFDWCMKKTTEENVYALKIYDDSDIPRLPDNNLIRFEDHSAEFPPTSTSQATCPVALPDPRLIAIHAAVAGVLHLSGAGRFFDVLLDKYLDNDGNPPAVQNWLEFEDMLEKELLRESIVSLLQNVTVH